MTTAAPTAIGLRYAGLDPGGFRRYVRTGSNVTWTC